MTLEEARKQGYEVLSGPYSRSEEKMMLAAKDALDQNGTIRYKVLITGLKWYILRQGMIEVLPESAIPEPPRERRVRLQVQVSASVRALVRPIALKRFQGSIGLLVEEALIEKYAPANDRLKMEFRREVREVMKRLPKNQVKGIADADRTNRTDGPPAVGSPGRSRDPLRKACPSNGAAHS